MTSAVLVLIGASVLGVAAASGRTGSMGGSARHAATHPARAGAPARLSARVRIEGQLLRPASAGKRSFSLVSTPGAIGTAAGFEDNDGDLAPNTSTTPLMDWNTFSPTWAGTAPYQTGTATANGYAFLGLTDATVTATDTAFKGGVKQNDECPLTPPSKAPNKDDLARAYIASKIVGGHTYLMLAWVRIPQNTPSADAHVAFEFNQSKTACANGDGLVQRTTGDLLVLYDFQSGAATIEIATWDHNAGAWGTPVSLTANGHAEAEVNTGDVSDTVAPSPETLGALEFGEAGIDLTAAIGDLSGGGKTCEQFGNVYAVTRSSGSSDSAQMEDLVGPAPLDVSNCASPTITTTLSETSGLPGDTVHDTATLHDASSDAGGTVAYTVYSDSACTLNAQAAGTKTVTNGVVPASDGIQFNSEGTFYWQAVYSGDDNNNGKTSTCTDEQLVIGKNSPTISTTLSETSGAIGDTVHDTATLHGATSGAGGTVAYTVYSDSACTLNAQAAGTKTVTNGVVPASNGIPFNVAGTYYWQAVYSGDTKNNGKTSTCTDEQLVIHPNAPTVSTLLSSDGSVSIGTQVTDSATLDGATSDAGGTISYAVYSDNECSSLVANLTPDPNTVTNGDAPDSTAWTPDSAGTFYFQATYHADANNGGQDIKSDCTSEQQVVNPNAPTVSTLLSTDGDSVSIGTQVTDSATLDGATSDAGGTISYAVYSDNECSSLVANLTPDPNTVTNGDAPDSNTWTPDSAGTFYFQATYHADANNGGQDIKSDCTSEQQVVTPNAPTVSTTLSASSPVVTGTAVHDSAVLSGTTSDAGGTISYAVYSDATCSTLVVDLTPSPNNVADGLAPDSNPNTFNTAGTFYFQATYSGDNNNTGPVSSPCASEQLVVQNPPPPPVTPPTPAPPVIDLAIAKTGAPSSSTVGSQITWTMTVTNNGPDGATGVNVGDPLPAGTSFVSVSTTQGTCTGGAIISCSLGSIAKGATVTVTLVTTSVQTGTLTNTATVVGTEAESNTANNTASASVVVNGVFTPPVQYCTALAVSPKSILVGHSTLLTLHVSQHKQAKAGVKVRIKGSTLSILTKPSNRKGVVTQRVNPKKAGIITFVPVAKKGCSNPRIGVIGVFTPPVTG